MRNNFHLFGFCSGFCPGKCWENKKNREMIQHRRWIILELKLNSSDRINIIDYNCTITFRSRFFLSKYIFPRLYFQIQQIILTEFGLLFHMWFSNVLLLHSVQITRLLLTLTTNSRAERTHYLVGDGRHCGLNLRRSWPSAKQAY